MSNKEEILNALLKNNNLLKNALENTNVSKSIINFLKSNPEILKSILNKNSILNKIQKSNSMPNETINNIKTYILKNPNVLEKKNIIIIIDNTLSSNRNILRKVIMNENVSNSIIKLNLLKKKNKNESEVNNLKNGSLNSKSLNNIKLEPNYISSNHPEEKVKNNLQSNKVE